MKNIVLALVFSFLSAASFGQKIRFCDSTNSWSVFNYSCGGDPYIVDSSVSRYNNYDTMIHGTLYKVFGSRRAKISFVREDTLMGKVFVILPLFDTDTAEKLLYDYTLNVGDTLRGLYVSEYVSSIDSVLINSVWHKIWNLLPANTLGTDPFAGYVVVEGIGSLYGPMNPVYPYFFENCVTLTCFGNEGTTPPLSYKVAGYFDNASSCDLVFGLGVNNIPSKTRSAYIYPNPVSKTLWVSAAAAVTQVAIANLMGQTVFTHEFNSETAQIDASGLPAGIYLVRINGTEVRKFVKE